MFLFQNRRTFPFTTTKTLFPLSLPSLLPTATLQPHGLNFLVESGYSFLHYGHEAKSVWRKANSFKSKWASPASPSNRVSVALNPISSRLLDPHTHQPLLSQEHLHHFRLFLAIVCKLIYTGRGRCNVVTCYINWFIFLWLFVRRNCEKWGLSAFVECCFTFICMVLPHYLTLD